MAGITQFIVAEPLVLTENLSVEMALEQNKALKASLLDLEKSEDQKNHSWNVLLPDFSLNGSVSGDDSVLNGSSLDSEDLTLSGYFESSVSLNPSARYYMKFDKASYESQCILYQIDEQELKVEVKKAFYYLIAYKESFDLEAKNLDLAKKRWLQTKNNFQNGLASELEVLEAQSSYENMKPSYTEIKTTYKTKLMSFKSLLGIGLEQEISIDGELSPEIIELDSNQLLKNFLLKRLDVQNALKSIQTEEALLAIEKFDDRAPELSLTLDWTNSASDMNNLNWADDASISASISIPLNGFIPGSEESVAISDAEKSVEQAKLNYADVVDNAEQEIRTLIMDLDGSREKIEITQANVEISQKTYEMTEDAYNKGTKEILDLDDAQNTLFSAKQDLLQSKYDYLSGLLDLEYALNTSTDEIKTINK
jgi:outer membrane protein TolC